MQNRKQELHVCDHSSVQDNFQAAIDPLHNYNVVERDHVETTYE
jgi:hypothetical protein